MEGGRGPESIRVIIGKKHQDPCIRKTGPDDDLLRDHLRQLRLDEEEEREEEEVDFLGGPDGTLVRDRQKDDVADLKKTH